MCLQQSDLSSVDDPCSLLFINSVRGEHTASEYGDNEMLAFAIYLRTLRKHFCLFRLLIY